MKSRFSALDIAAVVQDLQRVIGTYLQSVYDINARTFLLKFSRSDQKELVLAESGIRLHSTEYERDKPVRPSGFVMKLRKHLRKRRLTGVRQLGVDRVVVFEFCTYPEPCKLNNRLYFEFYGAGNVVLTDGDDTVLTLLRTVDSDALEGYRVGGLLRLHPPTELPELDRAALDALLKMDGKTVKQLLRSVMPCPAFVMDHAIALSESLTATTNVSPAIADAFIECVETARRTMIAPESCEGFIILDPANPEHFMDLQPIPLAQYASYPVRKFETFNHAADAYFSELESRRAAQRADSQKAAEERRLAAVEEEQLRRVDKLVADQEAALLRAEAVKVHQSLVDAAIHMILAALASGVDWIDLEELLKDEQSHGDNPIAEIIDRLDLTSNRMFISLDLNCAVRDIPIDLSKNALANSHALHTARKKAALKQAKTEAAANTALRSAATSKKTMQRRGREAASTVPLQKIRKTLWFEKFHYFVSSDGYLVLGGHDMHQNELLVKRYMRQNDLYVHADLHGAPTVIVKARGIGAIPPATLEQAGCMALCMSKAWDSKIVTSAWWVYSNQVSKSAPTGEYLTTGSFVIRGKKNILPPSQLVYGIGLLFKITPECVAAHVSDRKVAIVYDEPPVQPEIDEIEAEDQQSDENDNKELSSEQEESFESEENNAESDSQEESDESSENEPESEDALAENVDLTERAKSKIFYSVAIRRRLKRGMTLEEAIEAGKKAKETREEVKPEKSAEPKKVRGKLGKQKKIERKYGEQDDEERELAKRLLRGDGPKPKGRKQKQLHARQQQLEEVKALREAQKQKAEVVEQHASEGDVSEEEELVADGSLEPEIDSIVANLLPDDTVLFALPVCAPYVALNGYKFRVKLTPGPMKKGKAVKLCTAIFSKIADERERAFISVIHDSEWLASIRGQVKVSSTMLSSLQKSEKMKKKSKK